MSNTAAMNSVSSATQPVRRSTRIYEAIPLMIMGTDSWRAPYREQVLTIDVSAHGCRYNTKYPVTRFASGAGARPRAVGQAAPGRSRPVRNGHRTRKSRKYLGHQQPARRLAGVRGEREGPECTR
jgi:hypothetical protein